MNTVDTKPFTITGPSVRTHNAAEASGAGKIPALWAQFSQAHGAKAGTVYAVYAVYSDYESDASGEYTLTLGTQAPDGAADAVTVMPGSYLAFPADGERPGAVIAAWQAVWVYFAQLQPFERLYLTDFEQYDGLGAATVYIGVKPRG